MLKTINTINLTRKLKRHLKARQEPSILPLCEIRTVMVFLDVEDTSWKEARNAMLSFFLSNKISSKFFFVDRKKYKKNEIPKTNLEQTLYQEDLELRTDKAVVFIPKLIEQFPDLIISLIDSNDDNFEFIINCCNAKCKIGRIESSKGIYSVIVANPGEAKYNQLSAWTAVSKYLTTTF